MLSEAPGAVPPASAAAIRLHGELNDFVPPPRRDVPIAYAFRGTPSVRDALEAVGVPHPEVDRIEADGVSVGFGWKLHDGARIEAYAVPDGVVGRPAHGLVPGTPSPARFILDAHLGKLAGYLRMLGFDTAYASDADDEDLARRSAAQGRILLTRDRGLLRRSVVRHGYFLRSDQPRRQLDEVVRRYALAPETEPFSRCIRCNGPIEPVERAEIEDRLLPKTRRYYDEFGQCRSCREVYWQGSHYARMRRIVDEVLAGAADPAR